MLPLFSVPYASADGLDMILDPVVAPLSGASAEATGLAPDLAGLDRQWR